MKRSPSEADLAEEAARWDRGDFADGSWVDEPKAIIANERFYYLRGGDGVRRAIILCYSLNNGTIFGRGRGSYPRVFMPRGGWGALNDVQKTGLCQLIWAGTDDGDIVIIDSKTDEIIATHRVPNDRDAAVAW